MIILGIDPGTATTGFGVIKIPEDILGRKFDYGMELIGYGNIFTDKDKPMPDRLWKLSRELDSLIKKYQPEVLSIETLLLTSNQKTVMRVAEVRGVVIYEAVRAELKIFEASPPQIKLATTGYGKADKTQIVKMLKMLIKIDNFKTSDDELDAIAIALTAFAHMRF